MPDRLAATSLRFLTLALPSLLGLLLLAACGTDRGRLPSDDDDDDSAASDDDDDDSTEPADPEVPDSAHCAPASGWSEEWSALEEQVLVLTNEIRAAGANCGGDVYPPAGPLVMNPHLRCSARLHSRDMVERNFFAHDNPDGESPGDRMTQAGYAWTGWGENIAAGSATAEDVVDGWLNSPPHCSNMMVDWFTELGVGFYPGGDWGTMWTQNFGDR